MNQVTGSPRGSGACAGGGVRAVVVDPAVLEAELARVRIEYNSVRLHEAIGYVTPDDEHEGRGDQIRQARRQGLARASVMSSRCGHSPLMCPKKLSIQAWSVGVWGRPRCCAMAMSAMNAPGVGGGHRGPVVRDGEQDRPGRVIDGEVEALVGQQLKQALGLEGVLEDDLDLGGGLLDRHGRSTCG
jgi:hypothetical protein